jgi:hypothetical protein
MSYTCRFCGASIIYVAGLWLAYPASDVAGYCPMRLDDERHFPKL